MSGSTATPAAILAETPIGAEITFRSKNISDQILWNGKLEGFVSSTIAQTYSDLVSYNTAVRLADSTVSTDLTTLTFFLLTLNNSTGPAQRYAFAAEWILNGTLTVISQNVQVNVVVYDTSTSNHLAILTALRAAGFSCYIASVSS